MAAYLKNKEFREELIKSKMQNELTPRAVEMFILLANRANSRLSYTRPQDKEDCISSAIMDCLAYWRSYDPDKSQNAFAYFTTVCTNGYAKGWRALRGNFALGDMISTNNIYTL